MFMSEGLERQRALREQKELFTMVTRGLTTGHVCQCAVRRGGQAGRQRRGEAYVFNYHTTVLSAVNSIKTWGKQSTPGMVRQENTELSTSIQSLSASLQLLKGACSLSKVNSIEDNVLKSTED